MKHLNMPEKLKMKGEKMTIIKTASLFDLIIKSLVIKNKSSVGLYGGNLLIRDLFMYCMNVNSFYLEFLDT